MTRRLTNQYRHVLLTKWRYISQKEKSSAVERKFSKSNSFGFRARRMDFLGILSSRSFGSNIHELEQGILRYITPGENKIPDCRTISHFTTISSTNIQLFCPAPRCRRGQTLREIESTSTYLAFTPGKFISKSFTNVPTSFVASFPIVHLAPSGLCLLPGSELKLLDSNSVSR